MDIIISNSAQEPIYEQIVRQIKKQIIIGRLTSGEAIPSIRSLAKGLKISVITVKRAYEELEREGMIETVPAKGSFIAYYKRDFLREKKIGLLEENLHHLVSEAKELNISKEELQNMVDVLYREEQQ